MQQVELFTAEVVEGSSCLAGKAKRGKMSHESPVPMQIPPREALATAFHAPRGPLPPPCSVVRPCRDSPFPQQGSTLMPMRAGGIQLIFKMFIDLWYFQGRVRELELFHLLVHTPP